MTNDVVVEYAPRDGGFDDVHERVTRTAVARRLAALKGFDYAGDYDKAARYSGRIYFVRGDTLVGIDRAAELGIRDEHDLFGGVVPYRVAATKAITHPRIDESAAAPEGWSIEGADHALSEEAWQQAYTSHLVNWATEMVLGAREEGAAPQAHTHVRPAPRRGPPAGA